MSRSIVIDYPTAGTFTWKAPTDVSSVQIELWGGGGTGGPATGTASGAGGGAGGQYVKKQVTITPGADQTIVVGGVTTSQIATVVAGSDSTFNTTDAVAKGGAGGANATGATGAGGAGSTTGGVGDTVNAGGNGATGVSSTQSGGGGAAGTTSGTGANGSGATGATGVSPAGNGANGVAVANTRNTAGIGGGGSGGLSSSGTDRRGGNGSPGYARLTFTTSQVYMVTLTNKGQQNTTSLVSASVAPLANTLIVVTVNQRTSISTDPTLPTLSGLGLTWTQVSPSIQHDTGGVSRKRMTTWYAYASAAPTPGTITADFAGQQSTDTGMVVDMIYNADSSTPVVQTATAFDDTISVQTLTVTLAAFASTDNATYGVFGDGSNVGNTAGTGFVKLTDQNATSNNQLTSEWRFDNDTSVDMSFTQVEEIAGVALEIKRAQAATFGFPFQNKLNRNTLIRR